jgi:hypothetical protein
MQRDGWGLIQCLGRFGSFLDDPGLGLGTAVMQGGKPMSKFVVFSLMVFLTAGVSLAAPKSADRTIVGSIGDSMCGAKHMMPGESDKDCTVGCVKGGSKYILADDQGVVYQLSDQERPKEFAGQKVKVTGTVKGKDIQVTSIEAAH